MTLPHSLDEIIRMEMTTYGVKQAVLERRREIRAHRDQLLDDRCWLDDYSVWAMLSDSPEEPKRLPEFKEMRDRCTNYYVFRRRSKPDPVPTNAIRDKYLWDRDLNSMIKDQLIKELFKIQQAIKNHRDIQDKHRTVEDDRLLYKVLPEKMPADFRLPSRKDFLGEGLAPHAGCPSFWRSHQKCAWSCNIHKWGKCT